MLELDVRVWEQLRRVEEWTPEQRRVFERLRGKVEESGAGFGLLMSAPEQPGGPLSVRHYTRGAGGYTRRDYRSHLPQSEWARALTGTLLEPHRLREWEELPVPSGPDLHVCTHGTVDAACGKYGVPVYQALHQAGVRAWRTGHFGGHRFAATAVEFPSGLLWAHLTPELARGVAHRDRHPAEVRGHLRGFAGLPPLAQVLDRELLMRHGWDWLNAERTATVSGPEVTLTYVWQGRRGEVRARVEAAGRLAVPGSSHKAERLDVAQYRVEPGTWREGPAL
ncbi:sucraseferredoxin-like [Deinococcus phoenicis]|uniref:Sucraseferredoxin-like n=1 Tax=Deinococcus phoenicis TaxID=1476583 RepID=A0A016QLZ7_9DEIO|nr:sucraseferredoxin-like [Deinococcus phoenicis]